MFFCKNDPYQDLVSYSDRGHRGVYF